MGEGAKRALGYGLSAAVGGVLIYGGFIYESDPDLLTMLGSVEIQLTQASLMTQRSEKDPETAKARQKLIAEAGAWLDRVDRAHPGSAWTSWYRGYVAFLGNDFADAARLYEGTRFCSDCTDVLRDKSLVNQALMLRHLGRHAQAASLLRQHQPEFLEEHREIVRDQLAAAEAAAAGAGARAAAAPAESPGAGPPK